MKNIIFFVLIILFFFSSVEQDTEPTFDQKWKEVENSTVEAKIDTLKESGYYDFLVNLLKVYDREVAIKICSAKIGEALCREIINFLLGLI